MSHRNAHYWFWFLIFGVIGGLLFYNQNNHTIGSESIWLFLSGLLGILVSQNWLNQGKFAKPYDIIIGVIFTVVGILGILGGFDIHLLKGVNAPGGLLTASSILGLSLTGLAPIIHTFLGLVSLNHGLKNK